MSKVITHTSSLQLCTFVFVKLKVELFADIYTVNTHVAKLLAYMLLDYFIETCYLKRFFLGLFYYLKCSCTSVKLQDKKQQLRNNTKVSKAAIPPQGAM